MFAEIYLHAGHILTCLVVGLIAGWYAGFVMKGTGDSYGVIIDIVMGLIGGMIGGFLCAFLLNGHTGFWGNIMAAFIGACLLIVIARFVIRKRSRL